MVSIALHVQSSIMIAIAVFCFATLLGNSVVDAGDLWSLDDPIVIEGQSALNTVGNDPQSSGLLKLYNDRSIQEVLVKTWDGSWVGNINLPSATDVNLGSKFQIKCGSTWGVWLRYNGANKRIDSREELLVIVLDNNDGSGPKWMSEDEYVAPPSLPPLVAPTSAPTALDAIACDTNIKCPKNAFCNLDFLPFGAACETCPDALTCFQLGLPLDGAENCQSKCSKDSTPRKCHDSPCPTNEFCDLSNKGAFCAPCPEELNGCLMFGLSSGLQPTGVKNCQTECAKDNNFDDRVPQPIGGCVSNRSDGPVPADIWSTTAIIYDDKKYPPFKKYIITRGIILGAVGEIDDFFLEKVTITLNQMIPDNQNDNTLNRSAQEDMMIVMARKRTLIPIVKEDFWNNWNNDEREQYNFLARTYSTSCDVIFESSKNDLRGQPMEVIEHLLHFINMVGLHYLKFDEWGISRDSTLYEELEISCKKDFFNYDGCNSFGNNSDGKDRILLQEYSYWLIATWMDLVVPYGPRGVENEWALYNPSLLNEKQPDAYNLVVDEILELMAVPTNLEDYKFLDPVVNPTFEPSLKPTMKPTMKPTIDSCGLDDLTFLKTNKKGKKYNCKWVQRARGYNRKRKRCNSKAKRKKRFWFYCPATCAKVNAGPCRN